MYKMAIAKSMEEIIKSKEALKPESFQSFMVDAGRIIDLVGEVTSNSFDKGPARSRFEYFGGKLFGSFLR